MSTEADLISPDSVPTPRYSGEFEIHVTIGAEVSASLETFRQVCERLAVKPLLIELDRGSAPIQPMTASVCRGELADALREAARVAAGLDDAGFPPCRVKIEAAPTNADLPETDTEAARLPAGNYFEYHLKLLLNGEADTRPVRALCEAHGAHLSANAFRRRTDGTREQFVTLRCYAMGRVSADSRFRALMDALTGSGRAVLKSLCEYCVWDTNQALDEEWLEI
jgi:hypothetical protein